MNREKLSSLQHLESLTKTQKNIASLRRMNHIFSEDELDAIENKKETVRDNQLNSEPM